MLEQKIDELIAAVKENTAAIKAGKGVAVSAEKAEKPAKAAAEKPAKKPKGPTAEEVKAAGVAYAKEHGKPAAKKLITKHGGADLASIPEENYAAFIAECQGGGDDGDDGDDDDDL